MDPNSWRQEGAIYLWHYPKAKKDYFGWHFTADSAGSLSFVALCEAFLSANRASKRTLRLDPPTDIILRIPNCPLPSVAMESLILDYSIEEGNRWVVKSTLHRMELQLSRNKLETFCNAVRNIPRGDDEVTLGPDDKNAWDSMCLWIW